jgi:hypothetical protein
MSLAAKGASRREGAQDVIEGMGAMNSIIGRTAGALGLGAALLITGCSREASTVAAAATAGATVNCGEGRQAVVRPVIGSTASQIECVPVLTAPLAYPTTAFAPGVAAAPEAPAPVRERVVERVVYKQAPAQASARQRVVRRTEPFEPVETVEDGPTAEPAVYRTRTRTGTPGAEPVAYPASYPSRSGDPYPTEPERKNRSIGKSAVIIAGAAAGGAGVGAIMGGKSGAWKGAVVGAIGGTIYDQVTRRR